MWQELHLNVNILLRVIELDKKKGSYLAVFKDVERKLWCLKFNQEASWPSILQEDLQ
jgi:hypothetical protein